MPRSPLSPESLSSVPSSPPPSKQRASPPPQSNHDPAGLDSGSELSELTEDEQDSSETKSKASIRKQPTRRTRRSLIPDQMWGWYKKKSLSDEKSKHSEPPDSSIHPDHTNGLDDHSNSVDNDDDPDDPPDSPQESHDQPQPPPANSANKPSNGSLSDSEPDQPDRTQPNVRKPVSSPDEDSDSASDPSEPVDEDDGEGERTDSEDEEEPSNGDNFPGETVSPEELETPNPELADDATNMEVDIVPIAPAPAVAASSIMAGNTVIESPYPPSSAFSSRSPSPTPTKADKTKRAATPGKDAPDLSVPPEDADPAADEGEADEELEADMQPAHRAEALDVLATIELKFALLREKLYAEKMEALAWEEALVASGVHPELIHLDGELSKRRDKRLELASRRRTHEVNDATKRKRAAENAVWSWWKHERDELQVEMLSETNRKRRRLERERRALERPLPIRHIPHIPLELPAPIALRDIARNLAYAYAPGHVLGMSGAYPSLSMLSGIDVEGDLEFLNQNRRGWDMHRGPGSLQMLHHPYEQYGPAMDHSPGYGILPPGQQPPTSSILANYSIPPHLFNQPPPQQHPIPGHIGRERDRERDRERERERERDRHFAPDPTHPSNFAPPRSISPVHVNANGVLKATNGWMSGPGVIPVEERERIPTAKESRREREREREEARANHREEREREREREREQREKEGLDRERNHQLHLLQQQQQRHQQQQSNGPLPPQQHHPHHHHHHVVHHHHPMPPPPPSSYNHNQPGYPNHGNISPRRVARDLEYSRPRSNPPLSTEVIDLNSVSGPSKRSMVNVSPVLSSGREQRERGGEREREREREREIHDQNSRIPPMPHVQRSPRNAPSIGSGLAEHPRLPPVSNSNVDRDRDREREKERDRDREREREKERDRMMTPFVIPPSQATQAHFSTTPDVVSKVVREVRDMRERREPGPGLPAPEELVMPI